MPRKDRSLDEGFDTLAGNQVGGDRFVDFARVGNVDHFAGQKTFAGITLPIGLALGGFDKFRSQTPLRLDAQHAILFKQAYRAVVDIEFID